MELATYRKIHRAANALRAAGKPIDTPALIREHAGPVSKPKTADQWLVEMKAQSAMRMAAKGGN